MSKLVNDLIRKGYLKSDAIINAFSQINRVEFVPGEFEKACEADIPLPIGHGQTISQPLTVAFMLELLDPQSGQRILDVGSGSGWTTAMLCDIVGKDGKVTALERIPELCEFGKQNVGKFNYIQKGIVEFHNVDGTKGFAQNAPYDRILVSAMADEVPAALKEQLKVGGKMVIPVHNDICFLEKMPDGEFNREVYAGFSFVPLVEEDKTR